jgi:hypothetical protein
MNLNRIIEESGLRIDFVAAKLFPGNKHPYNALNRVLARGGKLDADQIKILAGLTGRTTDDLLCVTWSGRIEPNGLTLAKGDLRVNYVPGSGLFTITSATGLSVLEIGNFVIDEKTTTVRGFLELVEKAVKELT